MRSSFLDRLDHWIVEVLHDKATRPSHGAEREFVMAADLAEMISDYVLLRLAEHPNLCWTACEIDHVSNDAISDVTTFNEEEIAAAFIGAACELSIWETDDGVSLMIAHGIPAEEAREIAAAIEVVTEKLGERSQEIIQRLRAGTLSA